MASVMKQYITLVAEKVIGIFLSVTIEHLVVKLTLSWTQAYVHIIVMR